MAVTAFVRDSFSPLVILLVSAMRSSDWSLTLDFWTLTLTPQILPQCRPPSVPSPAGSSFHPYRGAPASAIVPYHRRTWQTACKEDLVINATYWKLLKQQATDTSTVKSALAHALIWHPKPFDFWIKEMAEQSLIYKGLYKLFIKIFFSSSWHIWHAGCYINSSLKFSSVLVDILGMQGGLYSRSVLIVLNYRIRCC